jgi:hypothetical protein
LIVLASTPPIADHQKREIVFRVTRGVCVYSRNLRRARPSTALPDGDGDADADADSEARARSNDYDGDAKPYLTTRQGFVYAMALVSGVRSVVAPDAAAQHQRFLPELQLNLLRGRHGSSHECAKGDIYSADLF